MERLRIEIAQIRHVRYTRDEEERLESQKWLVEEERKNKALSEQVEKLKELISKGVPHNKNRSRRTRKTPESPQVTMRSMRKRSRQAEDMVEADTVSPTRSMTKRSRQTEDIMEAKLSWLLNHNAVKQLTMDLSNSAGCPFQALGEYLTGMTLSTNNKYKRVCIVASHPSSGLSFTLTWVNNSAGEEAELLYKAESLGIFERVVPKWMIDVIKLSTSMSYVFFESLWSH
ncbi:hypothetical protein Bca101_019995 [Brassica carinata]